MVTSKIVMEHGGQISFESEEGEGTSFTIGFLRAIRHRLTGDIATGIGAKTKER
jgi:signal transduction histidine kinase